MSVDKPSEEKTVGGVPLDLKSIIQEPTQHFKTKGIFSGKEIEVGSYEGVRPDGKKVYELDVNDRLGVYFMNATWYESNFGVQNVVRFDLRTLNQETGIKSQDFYAGDFVDAFMHILSSRNHQVDNLQFSWVGKTEHDPAGSNYEEYQEALLSLPPDQAVLKTWTGRRIASKYGLTQLHNGIQSTDHGVTGILTRPTK